MNNIIIIDDVLDDIKLISGEITRRFTNRYKLNIYPKNKADHSKLVSYLEMFFSSDSKGIKVAEQFFNKQFQANKCNLIILLDYDFAKNNIDGIRIFEDIIKEKNYTLTLFFTGKDDNTVDLLRKKTVLCENVKVVKKPYCKLDSEEKIIDTKKLQEENILELIEKNLQKLERHVVR